MNNLMRYKLCVLVLVGNVILGLSPRPRVLRAGDWPQILGPNRDGRADGETLAAKWPKSGPPVHWTKSVGAGYAGPAVVGQRVVVFHRFDEIERIEALDVANGKRLWKADFPAKYRGGINSDKGPRCVPIIDKGRNKVIVFGAAGQLHCVSLSNGETNWSRDVYRDFEADDGYFGAGSSPIIAADRLLINVGGRDGAGLVAFSLDTGKTLWKSTDEGASYSSPTLTTIDDKSHVIFVTRLNAVSVDPANGDVRFRFPFGRRGPTVNAATPLVFGNHLFVAASYSVGAKLVKIDGKTIKSIWSNDQVMSSQYTTCVYRDGFLFGTDGREDVGVGTLRCIEATTGDVRWSIDRFGIAHLILADDKLLIARVDGELVLAEATDTEFRKLDSSRVFDGTVRALPALSNGRLYVRNSAGEQGELKCLDVGKAKQK